MLKSNFQCEVECVRFFGFMVIMDKNNEHQQFNSEWYDLFTSLILMTAVLVIFPLINRNIEDFNISFLDPASYTIVMKNLPMNVSKEDIHYFFRPILNGKISKESN